MQDSHPQHPQQHYPRAIMSANTNKYRPNPQMN